MFTDCLNISDADKAILDEADTETLANWWCMLNRYEWPEELPNPEKAEYIPGGRRGRLMDHIQGRIGIKECLRSWNKDSKPGVVFDKWWESKK